MVHAEEHTAVCSEIARERRIKRWTRKKEALISGTSSGFAPEENSVAFVLLPALFR